MGPTWRSCRRHHCRPMQCHRLGRRADPPLDAALPARGLRLEHYRTVARRRRAHPRANAHAGERHHDGAVNSLRPSRVAIAPALASVRRCEKEEVRREGERVSRGCRPWAGGWTERRAGERAASGARSSLPRELGLGSGEPEPADGSYPSRSKRSTVRSRWTDGIKVGGGASGATG